MASEFRTCSCIPLVRMFQRGKRECSYSKNIRPRADIRNCTMKREFRVLNTRTRKKFRHLLYRGRVPRFSQVCPLLLRRFCTHAWRVKNLLTRTQDCAQSSGAPLIQPTIQNTDHTFSEVDDTLLEPAYPQE